MSMPLPIRTLPWPGAPHHTTAFPGPPHTNFESVGSLNQVFAAEQNATLLMSDQKSARNEQTDLAKDADRAKRMNHATLFDLTQHHLSARNNACQEIDRNISECHSRGDKARKELDAAVCDALTLAKQEQRAEINENLRDMQDSTTDKLSILQSDFETLSKRLESQSNNFHKVLDEKVATLRIDYQSTINTKDATISQLEKDVGTLRQEQSTSRNELTQLREVVNKLQTMVVNGETQAAEINKKRNEISTKIQDTLAQQTADVEQLQTDISQLQAGVKSSPANDNLTQLDNKVHEMYQQLIQVKESIGQISTYVYGDGEGAEAYNPGIRTRLATLNTLVRKVQEMAGRPPAAADGESLEQLFYRLKENVDSFAPDVDDTIKSKFEPVNEEVQELKRSSDQVQARLSSLEQSQAKKPTESTQMQSQVSSLHAQIGQHGSELGEMTRQVQQHNSDLNVLRRYCMELQVRYSNLTSGLLVDSVLYRLQTEHAQSLPNFNQQIKWVNQGFEGRFSKFLTKYTSDLNGLSRQIQDHVRNSQPALYNQNAASGQLLSYQQVTNSLRDTRTDLMNEIHRAKSETQDSQSSIKAEHMQITASLKTMIDNNATKPELSTLRSLVNDSKTEIQTCKAELSTATNNALARITDLESNMTTLKDGFFKAGGSINDSEKLNAWVKAVQDHVTSLESSLHVLQEAFDEVHRYKQRKEKAKSASALTKPSLPSTAGQSFESEPPSSSLASGGETPAELMSKDNTNESSRKPKEL